MVTSRTQNSAGFSLIEMLVVIIVVGILASVAMQSMTSTVQDVRRIKTEREMDMLAKAIVGDPGRTQNNMRSDFGYVGDVGAFPPNLQALYQNPSGLATWNGPYLPPTYSQDSTGFRMDDWGTAYAYSGGTVINSTGSGSTISKEIADATGDYLLNTINGTILDAVNDPPGVDYVDSIDIVITYPNGAGGLASKTYSPDAAGAFTLDSIPVGSHTLRVIYTPDVDTLMRRLTVLPRHKSQLSYRFASAYFGGGGGGGTGGTYTLRPDGAGSITDLNLSGCATNYACVSEAVSDEDGSYVERAASSYRTDVYSVEDPPGSSGTIDGVTVYCRARKTQNNGSIRPTIYVGVTEYNGTAQNLNESYADYSYEWIVNPATGSAWTWAEITDLEAGVGLRGQNTNFPAYCTQVWVVVAYTN
jgi:general secretion pathway protein G